MSKNGLIFWKARAYHFECSYGNCSHFLIPYLKCKKTLPLISVDAKTRAVVLSMYNLLMQRQWSHYLKKLYPGKQIFRNLLLHYFVLSCFIVMFGVSILRVIMKYNTLFKVRYLSSSLHVAMSALFCFPYGIHTKCFTVS